MTDSPKSERATDEQIVRALDTLNRTEPGAGFAPDDGCSIVADGTRIGIIRDDEDRGQRVVTILELSEAWTQGLSAKELAKLDDRVEELLDVFVEAAIDAERAVDKPLRKAQRVAQAATFARAGEALNPLFDAITKGRRHRHLAPHDVETAHVVVRPLVRGGAV